MAWKLALIIITTYISTVGYASEIEPNNELGTSTALGAKNSGQLADQSDQDYFYFDVADLNPIRLYFYCPSASGFSHWIVGILDQNGIELSSQDVSTTSCNDSSPYVISITPTATGKHHIFVKWSSDYDLSTSSYYILNISEISKSALLITNARIGQTGDDTDVDYYYIDTASANIVNLDYSCGTNPNPGYWQVTLLDSSITVLASHEIFSNDCKLGDFYPGPYKIQFSPPVPGRYFVEVRKRSRYLLSTSNYTLAISDGINSCTDTGTLVPYQAQSGKVNIIDSQVSGKDSFEISLKNCGAVGKGLVNLQASKIQLETIDSASVPIKVQIGSLACSTTVPLRKVAKGGKTIFKK